MRSHILVSILSALVITVPVVAKQKREQNSETSKVPPSVAQAIAVARMIPAIASAKKVGVICNLGQDPSIDEGPCNVLVAYLESETPYTVLRCMAIAGGVLGVVCPEGQKVDLNVALAGVRKPGNSIYSHSIVATIGWPGQIADSQVPHFVCSPPKGGDVIDAVQCVAEETVDFMKERGMKLKTASKHPAVK